MKRGYGACVISHRLLPKPTVDALPLRLSAYRLFRTAFSNPLINKTPMSTETPPSDTTANASAPLGGSSTAAILSYIPVIGFIIALILHNGQKTELGTYHLRQSLGLHLTAFVLFFGATIFFMIVGIIPLVNIVFGAIAMVYFPLLSLGSVVFFILGLISAAQGQQKPLPLVGGKYQSWFANSFA